MRGVSSRKGETAQPDESHHQVLRRQDHDVRGGFGRYGDHAQVGTSGHRDRFGCKLFVPARKTRKSFNTDKCKKKMNK